MNREQVLIINVLSDYLNRKKTTPIKDLDWSIINTITKSHQIEGILYYQCKSFIPADFLHHYENSFYAALFSFKNKENNWRDIKKSFTSAKIPFLFIKGMDVSSCYPVPFLRTMGDLDILVHQKDKKKADQLLISLGFKCTEQKPEYDWIYHKSGIEIELHHQLVYDHNELVNLKKQMEFFNNCWNYAENGKANWNFHFLFLLAHLAKHLLYKGVGFRMFMDLAVVTKNVPDLNWDWIESKLIDLGLYKFAQVCLRLNEYWFGVKTPLNCLELEDDFIENATEKIFMNGVFGFSNPKSKEYSKYNSFTKYRGPRWMSRFFVLIRNLFPKYRDMQYASHYIFLNGRPWLLPIAWIYRYYLLFKGKTAGIENSLKNITIPDTKIREWEEELNSWGLLG